MFLDRQMVMQVLYAIQDKSKMLNSNRVTVVKNMGSRIMVKTKDGSIYSGDIPVGADGIHSTVRQQIYSGAKLGDNVVYWKENSKRPIVCFNRLYMNMDS